MFKPVYGVGGTLALSANSLAITMVPSNAMYSQLQSVLGEGGTDYTYLFLSDGVSVELVKVTQLNGGIMTVVRGQDGTVPHSFPIGSSMYFQLSGIAISDMITAAMALAGLPSTLTFTINAPNTVVKTGSDVAITIPKLPLTSPDGTVDVTTVGDGYGIDVVRGAFGCCP